MSLSPRSFPDVRNEDFSYQADGSVPFLIGSAICRRTESLLARPGLQPCGALSEFSHHARAGSSRFEGKSVRVWIRCAEAREFEVVADTKIPFDDGSISVSAVDDPEKGFTDFADLVELKPSRLFLRDSYR